MQRETVGVVGGNRAGLGGLGASGGAIACAATNRASRDVEMRLTGGEAVGQPGMLVLLSSAGGAIGVQVPPWRGIASPAARNDSVDRPPMPSPLIGEIPGNLC